MPQDPRGSYWRWRVDRLMQQAYQSAHSSSDGRRALLTMDDLRFSLGCTRAEVVQMLRAGVEVGAFRALHNPSGTIILVMSWLPSTVDSETIYTTRAALTAYLEEHHP